MASLRFGIGPAVARFARRAARRPRVRLAIALPSRLAAAPAQQPQSARQWAPSGALDGTFFGTGHSQCFPLSGSPNDDRTVREHNCYRFGLLQTFSTGNNIVDAFPVFGVSAGLSLYLS